MQADTPATIPVALGGVLSTGVAFFALFLPFLADPVAQAATIAFGNALILAGVVIVLNRTTTSSTAPVVASGTPVAIEGTEHTVTAEIPPQVDVDSEAAKSPPTDTISDEGTGA